MEAPKKIVTILGTMGFGKAGREITTGTIPRVTDLNEIGQLLATYRSHGHAILDTARLYCDGDTEQVLGAIGTKDFEVHTKAFPAASGGLSTANVKEQLGASLKALQVPSVDLFYLHMPDYSTPISESLRSAFLSSFFLSFPFRSIVLLGL